MTIFIKNKKIGLKYEILEKLEAGIKLLGFEVKSIKGKKGSLEGSHISIRGDEAILFNSNIPPYQPKNTPLDYDSKRNRILLLSKKQISHLANLEAQKGLTIIPVSMYNKGNKIKLEIAVVKGKKKYDKRETIKKKDIQRDIDREMKDRYR
ncbi:MAG: SsrA-binding protein SmpB [Candidatus Pacebacteria bacterium]|nr:SsrA-binding protein SmpB [Candidatus Paceibacterota bacterium]